MKTRVIKVSEGYVPQVANINHVLGIENWLGIDDKLKTYYDAEEQLDFCLQPTSWAAKLIIEQFLIKQKDKELLK